MIRIPLRIPKNRRQGSTLAFLNKPCVECGKPLISVAKYAWRKVKRHGRETLCANCGDNKFVSKPNK